MRTIRLDVQKKREVRSEANPRLFSYNVEFAEVTGGTFWKAYTPEQVAGKMAYVPPRLDESVNEAVNFDLVQLYRPVNLYDPKLRKLASAIGPSWVRVSGSWATKTYFDLDGSTGGTVPEDYVNVLTKEQWIGVLEFVKAVHGKLLMSFANCEGLHHAHEPWPLTEAKKYLEFSKAYGVPIDAVTFVNQPDTLDFGGFPKGYNIEDYRRDQEICLSYIRRAYPECLIVGPSTAAIELPKGLNRVMSFDPSRMFTIDQMLDGVPTLPDVLAYHLYFGKSERGGGPEHNRPEDALTDAYLNLWKEHAEFYGRARDRYMPGAELWVTEEGDGCLGGNTWASTFMDVFRTLNVHAGFSNVDRGLLCHNTLESSDYAYLERETFRTRPNYWGVYFYTQLMGTSVYDIPDNPVPQCHTYLRSRKDGRDGYAALIINTSEEGLTLETNADAELYVLTGNPENIRTVEAYLNGTLLREDEAGNIPAYSAVHAAAGQIELPPLSCTFAIF